jgi:hypothetical protein
MLWKMKCEVQYVYFCFFSYDILWIFNKYRMIFYKTNQNLLILTSCNTLKPKHSWNNVPSRPLTFEIHYCHWGLIISRTPPNLWALPFTKCASKKCISQKLNYIFQSWKHMNENNAQGYPYLSIINMLSTI